MPKLTVITKFNDKEKILSKSADGVIQTIEAITGDVQ